MDWMSADNKIPRSKAGYFIVVVVVVERSVTQFFFFGVVFVFVTFAVIYNNGMAPKAQALL